MGTKAVFAIASSKDRYYTRIIGMTMDGFPSNLYLFAKEFTRVCRKSGFDHTRLSQTQVFEVMDEIVYVRKDWLFIDQISNAEWLSYRSIFDPSTLMIKIYKEPSGRLMHNCAVPIIPSKTIFCSSHLVSHPPIIEGRRYIC